MRVCCSIELAHANDYYPHNTIADISCARTPERCDLTPWGNFRSWAQDNRLSLQFGIADSDPDPSMIIISMNAEWSLHAAVRYGGASVTSDRATEHLDSLTSFGQVSASDIGEWFGGDTANHDYAYTSSREDVAMLTEGTLSKYLFDFDIDVAIHRQTGIRRGD